MPELSQARECSVRTGVPYSQADGGGDERACCNRSADDGSDRPAVKRGVFDRQQQRPIERRSDYRPNGDRAAHSRSDRNFFTDCSADDCSNRRIISQRATDGCSNCRIISQRAADYGNIRRRTTEDPGITCGSYRMCDLPRGRLTWRAEIPLEPRWTDRGNLQGMSSRSMRFAA